MAIDFLGGRVKISAVDVERVVFVVGSSVCSVESSTRTSSVVTTSVVVVDEVVVSTLMHSPKKTNTTHFIQI